MNCLIVVTGIMDLLHKLEDFLLDLRFILSLYFKIEGVCERLLLYKIKREGTKGYRNGGSVGRGESSEKPPA